MSSPFINKSKWKILLQEHNFNIFSRKKSQFFLYFPNFLLYFHYKYLQMSQLSQFQQTIKISMPNKISKWTVEEQMMLRKLKDEQIQDQYVNWDKIAKELNQNFQKNSRTSKQCREKYINYLKFGQNVKINSLWSDQEVDIFKKMYQQIGPSWSIISSALMNRSQNSIKNKFNNSIRRAAKILCSFETNILKKSKKSITFEILVAIIDFINQLLKIILELELTVNYSSVLFTFRAKILDFALFDKEIEDIKIEQMTKLIKIVSSRLRCFGVFKVKNRKQWKLSRKSLGKVLNFDKVILEDRNKINEKIFTGLKQEQSTKNLAKAEQLNSPISPFQNVFDLPFEEQNFLTKTFGLKELTLQEQYLEIMGGENRNEFHQNLYFF